MSTQRFPSVAMSKFLTLTPKFPKELSLLELSELEQLLNTESSIPLQLTIRLFWVFDEFAGNVEKIGLGFAGGKREREGKTLGGIRDLGESMWVCIQGLGEG